MSFEEADDRLMVEWDVSEQVFGFEPARRKGSPACDLYP